MSSIVRCLFEAVGCVAISGLAQREYWEIKRKSSTAQRVNSGTSQLVDQSQSLTAEFYETLIQLDQQFLTRLQGIFHHEKQGQDRVIRQEDLEEFAQNICSVDESLLLSEMAAPSKTFRDKRPPFQIDEQYRVIPKDIVRKLVDLPDPRSQAPKQDPFRDKLNNDLIHTLNLIYERRRIVLDLSYDFDLQQTRVEKTIKIRAAELYDPSEAAWDLRLMLFLQVGSFAIFTGLLDKYWVVEKSVSKSSYSRLAKAPMWRAGLLSFPLISALYYFSSSILPMFFDEEIGFEDEELIEDQLARSAGLESASSSSLNAPGTGTTNAPDGSDSSGATPPVMERVQNYSNSLFGDDGEEEFMVSVAAPPPIWPGATKEDPFAPLRLLNTLLEKPIMDEIIFRGFLFHRLLKTGGLLTASVVGPIAYAACQMHPGNIDLRAVGMGLTKDDAFLMNVLQGGFAQTMYFGTGRLVFPILMNCGIRAYYVISEFSNRGDFVHEKLWLWMPMVRILGSVMLFDSWISEYKLNLRKYTSFGVNQPSILFPEAQKVTENGGKPTRQVIQLADRIMATFSTADIQGTSGTVNDINARAMDRAKDRHQKVLLPTDIEDLITSLQYATVVADKRHVSSLTWPERVARKEHEYMMQKVSKWENAARNISGSSGDSKNKKNKKNVVSGVWIDNRGMANVWVRPKLDSETGDAGTGDDDYDADLEEFISLNPRFTEMGTIASGVTGVLLAQVASALVQFRYPRGMDTNELRTFLMMELADTTKGFRELLDFAELDEIMTKWDVDQDREVTRTAYRNSDVLNVESTAAITAAIADEENAHSSPAAAMKNPTQAEFLDFMQLYYTAVLQETEELARKYAALKGAEFADFLAGRKANEEDIKRYQSDLLEFLNIAKRRVAIRVLSPHGLTVRRFYRLMKKREDKGEVEVTQLRQQWEQYFTGPLYRKRLFDVVEPSQFETPLLSLDALKSRRPPPSGSDPNAPTAHSASKGKS